MLENLSTTTETEQNIEEESKLIRRLEYRNPFQILVFKRLGLNPDDMDVFLKYSKIVSNLIDNPEHTEIRRLILEKKFDEAAELGVAEIRQSNKDILQAA